jgi:hypothetical protein
MIWVVAGAAGAALAGLGALTWWLLHRGGGQRLTTPEQALSVSAELLAGFAPVSAVLGDDGQAALIVGDGRRVAVLKVRGKGVVAREVEWRDVQATREGLRVATRDWRLGTILILGVDNLDVRRLAPQLRRL